MAKRKARKETLWMATAVNPKITTPFSPWVYTFDESTAKAMGKRLGRKYTMAKVRITEVLPKSKKSKKGTR